MNDRWEYPKGRPDLRDMRGHDFAKENIMSSFQSEKAMRRTKRILRALAQQAAGLVGDDNVTRVEISLYDDTVTVNEKPTLRHSVSQRVMKSQREGADGVLQQL